MPTKTLYQILQVDPKASTEVIEAAYHRLARIYHPDVNNSSDAVTIMQGLNDAYAILRDPQKRQKYDKSLVEAIKPRYQASQDKPTPAHQSQAQQPQYHQPRRPESVPDFPVHCQSCGRSDSTLRMCVFPYVISILILTFRRAWVGLYCRNCRRKEMLKAKLLTTFLGWWGIPFGPIYTLGVIFSPSEGNIPDDINAAYLASLSGFFLNGKQLAYAQEAMEASLGFRSNRELEVIYHNIFGSGKRTFSKPAQGAGSGLLFGLAVILVVALGLCYFSGFFYTPSTILQPTPTPSCNNWYSISNSDLGEYLCVWGTVTEVGSNAYYKTIIRFSDSPTKIIFVEKKETWDVSAGSCVAAVGKIIQLENSLAIDINGNLYNCP